MKMFARLSLCLGLAITCSQASLRAQSQDIGLTMDGGMLPVVYGQECGPVGCTPLIGGAVGGGDTRTLTHFSAPGTLFIVALGVPGPCLAVPGFDNGLLLMDAIVLDFGLTAAPPFNPLPCQQSFGFASFTLPHGLPAGITFRMQSLGFSLSGAFGFGPAIEAVTV